jgi:hypothetical protein
MLRCADGRVVLRACTQDAMNAIFNATGQAPAASKSVAGRIEGYGGGEDAKPEADLPPPSSFASSHAAGAG